MPKTFSTKTRSKAYQAFCRELGPAQVQKNVTVAPYTTFKIGGSADLFVAAQTPETLVSAVAAARRHKIPYFLLGCGANILFGDKGFRGVVIHNQANQITVDADNHQISAESGAVVYPDLIRVAVSKGLSGLEHYVGIPSTVGGALWQNLHFLSPPPKRERTMFIEEVLLEADLYTEEGQRITRGVEYFEFGYDQSILHERDDIVLNATFQLTPGRVERMRDITRANLAWRQERHPPLDTEPSAGSIFKKIEGVGAGRLIDECGLKGTTIGGAEITRRHANIMINRGGATAADVCALIERVQEVVLRETGYELEPEISFVGEFATSLPVKQ